MKFRIQDLGVWKDVEFALGDLTILCGENNTGKTYIAYALYEFLTAVSMTLSTRYSLPKEMYTNLNKDKHLKIPLPVFIDAVNELLLLSGKEAGKKSKLVSQKSKGSNFAPVQVILDDSDWDRFKEKRTVILNGNEYSISSSQNGKKPHIEIHVKERQKPKASNNLHDILPTSFFNQFAFQFLVASSLFPTFSFASAERTGAVMFHSELNFKRSELLETMRTQNDKEAMELYSSVFKGYPQPVEDNIKYLTALPELTDKESSLAKECPELLEEFADLLGGGFVVSTEKGVQFRPAKTGHTLEMDQSSSSVRSLVHLGHYLRHSARAGDMLMIDEPELNLHPRNQRRMARLLARLVNSGIRVFLTTHSDYIIREFNALLLFGKQTPNAVKIMEQEGYRVEECLKPDQLQVYVAEETPAAGKPSTPRKRKTRTNGMTLTPIEVNTDSGIEIRTFDDVIEDMNRIQDLLLYGDA